MPDPQTVPPPGPSPTPTPVPTAAIKIKEIIAQTEGAIIVPDLASIPTFEVLDDYLAECSPAAGGYFIVFPEVTSFMSAEDFGEKFPQ